MKHANRIVLCALSCRAVAINHDLKALLRTAQVLHQLLEYSKTTMACDKDTDAKVLSHSMTNIQLLNYLMCFVQIAEGVDWPCCMPSFT